MATQLQLVTDRDTAILARQFTDLYIVGKGQAAIDLLLDSHMSEAKPIVWEYFNDCVDLFIDDHLTRFELVRENRKL